MPFHTLRILFFYCIAGVKSRLSRCAQRTGEDPLVVVGRSVDIQRPSRRKRFWNAHRRVRNNGHANETTFHTPRGAEGSTRGGW